MAKKILTRQIKLSFKKVHHIIMKKLITILFCGASILFAQLSACGQDSSRTGAIQKINKTSEQSDKLYGEKIQQQSISAKTFQTVDTAIANKSNRAKNKNKKCRHRRH